MVLQAGDATAGDCGRGQNVPNGSATQEQRLSSAHLAIGWALSLPSIDEHRDQKRITAVEVLESGD
jgi:hypothetical protein